jgi:ABC-type sugar transport system substrate-binding protein
MRLRANNTLSMKNLFASACVASLLAAMASAQSSEKHIVIVPHATDRNGVMVERFTTEAKERKLDASHFAAEAVPPTQSEECLQALEDRPAALVVFPDSEHGWDKALVAAAKAKVPVISVGRPIFADKAEAKALFAMPDFEQQGTMAATWIVNSLHGKGGVVEVRGVDDGTPSIERQQGFMAVLGKNRGIAIVASISPLPTKPRAKATKPAESEMPDQTLAHRLDDLLQTKGDRIAAIFCHDEFGAKQVSAAILRAEAASNHSSIKIVAIDQGEGLGGVFEGSRIGASIECHPSPESVVLGAVERATLGEKLPSSIVFKSILIEHGPQGEKSKESTK